MNTKPDSSSRSDDAGGDAREWLSPSDALARFELDDADRQAARSAGREQPRYGVRTGALGLLLPADTVSEVIQNPKIFPVPKTPRWLEGLLNLRGNLVPVLAIDELLGGSDDDARDKVLVVIDKGELAVGLLVDGYPRVAALDHPIGHKLPLPERLREHLRCAYVEGDDIWLELDLPGLIVSIAAQAAA